MPKKKTRKPKLSQESPRAKRPPAKGKPARKLRQNPRQPAKRLKEERHDRRTPQTNPTRAPAAVLKPAGKKIRDRKRATEDRRQAVRDDKARADKFYEGFDGWTSHDKKRDRERERNAAHSRSGRDISIDLPKCTDFNLRAECEKSFRTMCEKVFPQRFPLAWSDAHLEAIRLIQQCIDEGGLFALAMARGSGKSTLCECGVIWGANKGKRRFIAPIGATEGHATEMLQSIKTEYETNDMLLGLWPEICHPIRKLEGISNRANGQTFKGERTRIEWAKKVIVLPTIPGSAASGVVIKCAGITGRVRGMKFQRPDGEAIRPDCVIIDDPQTNRSAKSAYQVNQRLEVLTGAILGLAGPDKKIAGVMPCTVIQRDDMADQILDRDRHPEWQGQRTKLIYQWPTNKELWDEYREIRAQSLRNGGGGKEATEFYRKNRAAMDEGAVIGWKERYLKDELSAIQHAVNLWMDKPLTADAEYNSEPLKDEKPNAARVLSASFIAGKTNNLARHTVPLWATKITGKIDVQHSVLYWVVTAWSDNFAGAVIDYGTWPDQGRAHFNLRSITKTLAKHYPGHNRDAAVLAGLRDLFKRICPLEWLREDNVAMRIDKCSTDAADGELVEVIYEAIRNSDFAGQLIPSHGRGIGPTKTPMAEYKVKPGEKLGSHWLQTRVGKRAIRGLFEDTNFWKSFVHEGFALPLGTPGALSLFGNKNTDHRMFGEHLAAQDCTSVYSEANDRWVKVWSKKPDHPDDHWFDCLCGSACLASFEGAQLPGRELTKKKKPRPKTEYWD